MAQVTAEIKMSGTKKKNGDLTGVGRYRISFFGKVILQVQYYIVKQRQQSEGRYHPHPKLVVGLGWRDATREDMKIDTKLRDALLEGVVHQLKK